MSIDTRTDVTKLTVAFRKFENVAKKIRQWNPCVLQPVDTDLVISTSGAVKTSLFHTQYPQESKTGYLAKCVNVMTRKLFYPRISRNRRH
jgi:hypothetical protein